MNFDQVRRSFMKKMDSLWVDEYDAAFDKIPGGDDVAFKRYAELLDEYFVCYWHFFAALNEMLTPDELSRVADNQISESTRKLELVWRNTIDAQVRKAEELKIESRSRSLPLLLSTFQKAEALLKEARRGDTIQERISKSRQAADLLEIFIQRLEVAK